MDASDLVTRLAAIPGRVAGSDAERRAARLLARELRSMPGRRPRVQTLWTRPSWEPVLALLCGLAVLGTVVSVDHPRTGTALCGAALVLFALDLSGRFPLLRRLTFARATQNVVCRSSREAPVRLVITAAVDSPRDGLFARGAGARLVARARRVLGGALPGGFGVVAGALLLATVLAGVRALDAEGTWLGVAQLLPAVVLVAAVGIALDRAAGDTGPGANANGSACATALALVAALDRVPPRSLAVDVVLAGAGETHALGMRRWIAARRREGVRPEEVVVLHLAPCGAGRPVWWTRDGLVLPLGYHPQLLELAAQVADGERHLGARPVTGRGATGARAARAVGWPAIAVGCLPDDDVVPEAGGPQDTTADAAAMAACRDFCLALIAALDRRLAPPSAG